MRNSQGEAKVGPCRKLRIHSMITFGFRAFTDGGGSSAVGCAGARFAGLERSVTVTGFGLLWCSEIRLTEFGQTYGNWEGGFPGLKPLSFLWFELARLKPHPPAEILRFFALLRMTSVMLRMSGLPGPAGGLVRRRRASCRACACGPVVRPCGRSCVQSGRWQRQARGRGGRPCGRGSGRG